MSIGARPLTVASPSALLPRRARLAESGVIITADLVAILAAWLVTGSPLVLVAVVPAVLYWSSAGLYGRRFSLSVLDDLSRIALGCLWGLLALLLLGHRPAIVSVVAVLFAAVVLARCVSYALLLHWRTSGRVAYPVVLVGAGLNGVSLAQRIDEHPRCGLRPVGFLDSAPPVGDLPYPLLGEPKELARVLQDHGVTDVILAYGRMPTAELVAVLRTCHRLDVEIHMLPRLFEMHRLTAGTDNVWGLPLVRLRQPIASIWALRVKRVLDVIMSAAALVLLAPVMAVIAGAVRLDLGRGVIFRQVRVGLDGRPFTVRKFRSMRDLPEGAEASWSARDEDRMGRVGTFIRRYSLDEIPQLWNVLIGDMSMVGPRPERPEYVDDFSRAYPRYGDRHRVPAGLTGLAAVHGLRGDTSIEDRAYFDNLYIENWSLWLDAKILARTALAVVRGTGA